MPAADRHAGADAAAHLLATLAAAREGFAAGDAIAASAELDGVVAACAALDAAGVRLDPDALRRARELHHACAVAALAAQVALNEKLEQAAGARRAVRAYAA